MDKSTQTAVFSVWEAKEPYLIVRDLFSCSFFSSFPPSKNPFKERSLIKCCHIPTQAFAEAIDLKEKLKKIGVHPQPKKTKEQVESERQVKIHRYIAPQR